MLSGVPNILGPLREPGIIEGPAATAAVVWPPPGPTPAQESGAAGLPTGPAPAQQAQGVMYNAGCNGSHFIDEGAQEGGGRVKRRRAPRHCSDCGHLKQTGPSAGTTYHRCLELDIALPISGRGERGLQTGTNVPAPWMFGAKH